MDCLRRQKAKGAVGRAWGWSTTRPLLRTPTALPEVVLGSWSRPKTRITFATASAAEPSRAELGWAGLSWAELGWAELGRAHTSEFAFAAGDMDARWTPALYCPWDGSRRRDSATVLLS